MKGKINEKGIMCRNKSYTSAPLKGCINDASGIATLLEAHGDGSPNFDVRLETDVPTKAKLKEMIVELFTGDCDTALLFFSGHGFLNDIGGYIVTPDYKRYDEGFPWMKYFH